jgi:hypothetical protein
VTSSVIRSLAVCLVIGLLLVSWKGDRHYKFKLT